jgi:hypothetical protein
MTPNPVCYNGLNLPDSAIHTGAVSLGIVPKDYRDDTAQRWRSGISPNGSIVLYSDTYSLGLATEANSEPRIWWTSHSGDAQLKITELLSRLPERASLNYEVFQTYEDAISWMHGNRGKYSLLNCDYPEYQIPSATCIFNIESGFLPSCPGAGSTIYNLANPKASLGNDVNPYALSFNAFTIEPNATYDMHVGEIGQEGGIDFRTAGYIQSTNLVPAIGFIEKSIVLDAIIDVSTAASSTILTLVDNGGAEVLRVDFDLTTKVFTVSYPTGPSTLAFQTMATAVTQDMHVVIAIPNSATKANLAACQIFVNGQQLEPGDATASSITWANPARIRLGNNRSTNKPMGRLKSARMHLVSIEETNAFTVELANNQYAQVLSRYNFTEIP